MAAIFRNVVAGIFALQSAALHMLYASIRIEEGGSLPWYLIGGACSAAFTAMLIWRGRSIIA